MKKILVTEDSQGWQNFHRDMLTKIYGEDTKIDSAICAKDGYDFVYNNMSEPYDLIITDLQMESDFEPKYAGEWFTEQVRMLSKYNRTPIVIISACYNSRTIAELLGVEVLPKHSAANDLMSYKLKMLELLPL